MAERDITRDCEKIFVKRTLERERHILTNFLTEVYISLEEIEKLMLDEPTWEMSETALDRIKMEREYLIRTLHRERKNILSILTVISVCAYATHHINQESLKTFDQRVHTLRMKYAAAERSAHA
ncbi:hypothetical protein TNCV_1516231 [Trichonephila clavipes]|nr:hypothetical protein TNCV_1516231 [Trichonephila clavipes]